MGTPTDTALLDFGLSLGGNFHAQRQVSKLLKVEPFNSVNKQMSVLPTLPKGGLQAHCKGDPKIILATCDKVITKNSNTVPLDEASINYLNNTIIQFANETLQTLGLAYMELENGFSTKNPIPGSGYTFIGVVGMKDTVCPDVKEPVADCHSAGITV